MYDYKKIITLEEAFAKHPDKPDLEQITQLLQSVAPDLRRGMLATLKGQVVTYVINNNDPEIAPFEPDYNNTQQDKWGAWSIGGDSTGAGFRFCDVGWANAGSSAVGGARLALKDKARLQHMKKHFPDIYKECYLMLK